MALVPHHFLVHLAYPCSYVKKMPRRDDDRLLDLPTDCRIDNFAAMDDRRNFAEVLIAWNELGLGVQVEVRGKENAPVGDVARPARSDGVTLWLDTRGDRTSHRASRYCHQFHFLASGGGPAGDEAIATQTKINRALADAPQTPATIAMRLTSRKSGYILEAFVPEAVLMATTRSSIAGLGSIMPSATMSLGSRSWGSVPSSPFGKIRHCGAFLNW